MAKITRKRSSSDFDYEVTWWDNDGVVSIERFKTHREAVQFVIATESALLSEAVEVFNAALASLSLEPYHRVAVRL
jgi:hypothetical protein